MYIQCSSPAPGRGRVLRPASSPSEPRLAALVGWLDSCCLSPSSSGWQERRRQHPQAAAAPWSAAPASSGEGARQRRRGHRPLVAPAAFDGGERRRARSYPDAAGGCARAESTRRVGWPDRARQDRASSTQLLLPGWPLRRRGGSAACR
eukprot:scaffold1261_cov377-Prasinococcus_capsulatus_cf.AAC.9